jgi:SAM-dependent methyltransferase
LHGQELFAYFEQHPEAGAIYNAAMSSTSRLTNRAVVAAYDFSGIRTLVDVGGGYGGLLTAILRANPTVHGVLFDLPRVAAQAAEQIAGAGLAERCDVVGGDMFDSLPTGADAYVMSEVLHGFQDDRASVILGNCRRAVAAEGRLLIVDLVLPPGDEPFFGSLLDLEMLVIAGGKERTAAEYGELLASSGWRLLRVHPTLSLQSIVEAAPA